MTQEALIHYNIKQALVAASERDTKQMFLTMKNTARVLRNASSEQVVAMENRPGGCQFEDIRPLVAGVRGRAALEASEVNGGVVSAGKCIGLIDDVPTCAELIERMVASAANTSIAHAPGATEVLPAKGDGAQCMPAASP